MKTIGALIGAALGVVALTILFALPVGWGLMIALGIFHASFGAVPAFGFWASVLVAGVFRALVAAVGSSSGSGGNS